MKMFIGGKMTTLLKKKYERQYNYIETKYLGVNIMQKFNKTYI